MQTKTLTIGAAAIMMRTIIIDMKNNPTIKVKQVNGKTNFLKVMPKVIHNMVMIATTATALKTKPTPLRKTT